MPDLVDLVFEIGTEEMPARFQPGLCRDLKEILAAKLAEAGVLDGSGQINTYATPRRLAALVAGLAPEQPKSEELVMGPPARVAFGPDGEPTKAAIGFAKTQGVDLADAFTHTTDKGEYLAVRKATGGARTLDLLPEILAATVAALPFPKKMHWGSGDFTFGRSIRWFLALLDDQIVKFEVAGLTSSNTTLGHRVHGFGPWEVASAQDYLGVIKDKAHVVLDADERKRLIREQGDALAAEAGGSIVWNESLLDEVAGLAEWPRPILAGFDASFLELPREVLLTSMQSHQKSFGLEGKNGKLLPNFLTTLNLEPKDVALVRKGWERVLKARLEDARFFWKTDLGADLNHWLDELENVIYLGPLGSMGDKSRRLKALCAWLALETKAENGADIARAGRLAKADLVSEMVGEFDKLQGIMGAIYARKQGESETVAQAIYEHYLPAGPDSPVPSTKEGALLAMADKADALAGCFGLDMIPTGANDPYGLRRAALGICRIVLDKDLRLDLAKFLEQAFDLYGDIDWKLDRRQALDKLLAFVGQRLKGLFTSQGFETLVVEAVVSASMPKTWSTDVWGCKARLGALDAFSKEPDFEQAVLTFKRAGNIILKQGSESGIELTGAYSRDLLKEEAEIALADAVESFIPRFDELWAKDAYGELMGMLRELRPSVDAFFDNVMVMCEEADLRQNRLNLLKSLVDRLSKLADFNALQV